jgi:hypothetical protein
MQSNSCPGSRTVYSMASPTISLSGRGRKGVVQQNEERSGSGHVTSSANGQHLFLSGQAPTMVMSPHFPPINNAGGVLSDNYNSFLSRIYPQHFNHPFLMGGPSPASSAFINPAYAAAMQHPQFWQQHLRSIQTSTPTHKSIHLDLGAAQSKAGLKNSTVSSTGNEKQKGEWQGSGRVNHGHGRGQASPSPSPSHSIISESEVPAGPHATSNGYRFSSSSPSPSAGAIREQDGFSEEMSSQCSIGPMDDDEEMQLESAGVHGQASLRVRSLISDKNFKLLKTFYDGNPWPKKSDLAALANRCGLKRRVVQVLLPISTTRITRTIAN